MSTLANIRAKVRKITQSPSESQLSTADIDTYINTFILYDMPNKDTIFSLRKTFTFYTSPNVAEYATTNTLADDPLYNFKNMYTNIIPPVFVGGRQSFYTQSRSEFYRDNMQATYIQSIGTGNGVTTNFTGTFGYHPILQNNITISAMHTDGTGSRNGIKLKDVPATVNGTIATVGSFYSVDDATTVYGTINYVTGVYTITFANAPDANTGIYAEYWPYAAGYPSSVLFYGDTFYLRPVPDKVYPVTFDARILPSQLLAFDQHPDIDQWWQYIAYGACKKVFEDRLNDEDIARIEPYMQEQQVLCMRKTIMQNSSQRSATIYNQQPIGCPWYRGDWSIY